MHWIWQLLLYLIGVNTNAAPQGSNRSSGDGLFHCDEPNCGRTFLTNSGRRRHVLKVHKAKTESRKPCRFSCGKSYAVSSSQSLRLHERTCEKNPAHEQSGSRISCQYNCG